MSSIVSIHSFRGGTGKSNTTANLAAQMALTGRQVGVIDTDIMSPGIHVIFGLDQSSMGNSLNDYLWGKCSIEQTAHDVTRSAGENVPGRIFLIPSSINAGEIARVLREGYDVGLLNEGFRQLVDRLRLDVLLIDTHPGLNEETLLSIAISKALIVVMRPDSQDYLGTSVTVEVARKLEVPNLQIVVNKVPTGFDPVAIRKRVEETYGAPVAAVLPLSEDVTRLASSGIFSVKYPDHPVTQGFIEIARRVME